MMVQHTFIDCSPKPSVQHWTRSSIVGKTWCQGNTLITIQVEDSGTYEVVFRRPVGVTVLSTTLLNEIGRMNVVEEEMQKFHLPLTKEHVKRSRSTSDGSVFSKQLADEDMSTFNSLPRKLSEDGANLLEKDMTSFSIDPTFLLLQFQPYPTLGTSLEAPIPLKNDEMTIRALSVLDRTPSIDLHKIGVVYVGPNQNTEAQILSNCSGSQHYTKFIYGLGTLVPLANNREIYTGGLDTSPDCFDGPFGLLYIPDQRLSQMVFHVITMMPSRDHDPLGTAKKRHIGNDFVNIIWNESGVAYDRETIPGQFNLVQIVIVPFETVEGNFERDVFMVSIGYRSDLPMIAPLPTLVSGSCLASFVRQNSIYCNMVAQVFTSGEASSNAKERLRQIKRIKGRLERPEPNGGLDFTNLV